MAIFRTLIIAAISGSLYTVSAQLIYESFIQESCSPRGPVNGTCVFCPCEYENPGYKQCADGLQECADVPSGNKTCGPSQVFEYGSGAFSSSVENQVDAGIGACGDGYCNWVYESYYYQCCDCPRGLVAVRNIAN